MEQRKFGVEFDVAISKKDSDKLSELDDRTLEEESNSRANEIFRMVNAAEWSRSYSSSIPLVNGAAVQLDIGRCDVTSKTVEYKTPPVSWSEIYAAIKQGEELIVKSCQERNKFQFYKISFTDIIKPSIIGTHYNFDPPANLYEARKFLCQTDGATDLDVNNDEGEVLKRLSIIISYITGAGFWDIKSQTLFPSDRNWAVAKMPNTEEIASVSVPKAKGIVYIVDHKGKRRIRHITRIHLSTLDAPRFPWPFYVQLGLMDLAVLTYGYYSRIGILSDDIMYLPISATANLPIYRDDYNSTPISWLNQTLDWFWKAFLFASKELGVAEGYHLWAIEEFEFALNALKKKKIDKLLGTCEWITYHHLITEFYEQERGNYSTDELAWLVADIFMDFKRYDSDWPEYLQTLYPSRSIYGF